jgi:threonyl-tRNA synthetase
MAQVLEQVYPGVKLTLGPTISNGFYYEVSILRDQKSQKLTLRKVRMIAFTEFQGKA